MARSQREAVAGLFARLSSECPLIAPAASAGEGRSAYDAASWVALENGIRQDTGLRPSPHQYEGWLGVECPSVKSAVWMMRALVVSNVLARREAVILFVPVNRTSDPDGLRVRDSLARIRRLAAARGVA